MLILDVFTDLCALKSTLDCRCRWIDIYG